VEISIHAVSPLFGTGAAAAAAAAGAAAVATVCAKAHPELNIVPMRPSPKALAAPFDGATFIR
jgi:ABC-type uncharacterized transport system permease subunit